MDGERFDRGADLRPSAFHIEAERGGRVEVISGVARRRRWSRDEKSHITSESFIPGANVSDVARRHGVSLGLLHYWRRVARQDAHQTPQSFVPILQSETAPVGCSIKPLDVGVIEIEFCGAHIRLRGGVDGGALATVLAAVRRA